MVIKPPPNHHHQPEMFLGFTWLKNLISCRQASSDYYWKIKKFQKFDINESFIFQEQV